MDPAQKNPLPSDDMGTMPMFPGQDPPSSGEARSNGTFLPVTPEREESPVRRAQTVAPEFIGGSKGSTVAVVGPVGPPELGPPMPGKYRALRKLGAGAMGEVWLVLHRELGIERALKMISLGKDYSPEMRARLRREARAMAMFTHPNAVAVHDASTSGDIAYIEMEYVVGRSLDKVLVPGMPGDLAWTARILDQLCGVLHLAHDRGIVHRDLKPSNMMLLDGQPEGQEHLKVLDFGIAKILGPANGEVEELQTRQGAIMGTLAYMSPEQIEGDSTQLDGRSDIYSTGIILYELLTGHRPFTSPGFRITLDHLSTPPPPFATKNPGVSFPPGVEQVVMRCLQKDPALRPQTARELAEEFHRAANIHDDDAPGVVESGTNSRRAFFLGGLAAVAGTAGLVGWIRTRPPATAIDLEPSSLALRAGSSAILTVSPGPWARGRKAAISVRNAPPGVTVEKLGGDDERGWRYQVTADLDAKKVSKGSPLIFRVVAGTTHHDAAVDLSLLPPGVAQLPDGFRALPESKLRRVGDRIYPDRIVRFLSPDDPVVFLLILKRRNGDPAPFYIMRDKVSIRNYNTYLATLPQDQQKLRIIIPSGGRNDRFPATGMTAHEAYDFACWLGNWKDHCNLPTTFQWEKAAGFSDHDERWPDGPYLGHWSKGDKTLVAVGREPDEPGLPVGAATADVSWCGCRDMAGNGVEWTRDGQSQGQTLSHPPQDGHLNIQLRGCRVESLWPLKFNDVRMESKEAYRCDERDPDLGFRVVIEDLDLK